MTSRHSFLIGRAVIFATLLISAGATSISVAAGAGDDRLQRIAGDAPAADFAQALVPAAVAWKDSGSLGVETRALVGK